jgi:uncharacterized protein YlxW (UPF0749 family)
MARFPIPITLPGLHEGRAHTIARPSTRMIVLSFCLALLGILGGLALSMQWQVRSASNQPGVTRQGSDKVAVVQTIARLESEQADLKRQVTELRDKLATLQNDVANRRANLAGITDALDRERVASGMMPLEGTGIVASYNDSASQVINPNEDPANYILHDYDLRDVLNALWAAGAEAISVNDERITANTSLYCVGTTIICNATRLSPPYVITAIGSPDDLEAALRSSAQVEPLNQRALIYDLPIEIRKEAKVTVPAYKGGYLFHYAETGDTGP